MTDKPLEDAAAEPLGPVSRPSKVDGRVANAAARCRRPVGMGRLVRADVVL
jgi:hypothetical protein